MTENDNHHQQDIYKRLDRLEESDQSLEKSISDLTVEIRVMANATTTMQETLEKLSDLWTDYHKVDKRVANVEQAIRAVEFVAGGFVIAIVGLAVTAIFGSGGP